MKSSIEGKKILLTRPKDQNAEWADKLKTLGAIPFVFPLIEIQPVNESIEIQEIISHLYQYDWIIFASVNAAKYASEIIDSILLSPHRIFIAAIGSKTAAYLESRGLVVDFMPSSFTSSNLSEEIEDIEHKHILIPRTNIADDDLSERLKKRGAVVKEITVYNTHKITEKREELQKMIDEGMDVVTFASSSAAESFSEMKIDKKDTKIAVIGPVTAERCIEMGIKPDIVAENYTIDGLTHAMLSYFDKAHNS